MRDFLSGAAASPILYLFVLLGFVACDIKPTEPSGVLDAQVGEDQGPQAAVDCRFEAYACAAGFSCEASSAGGYDCVPIESPSPDMAPEVISDMEPDMDPNMEPDMEPDMLVDPPTPPECGDGVRNQDSEECDDGNQNDADGCLSACLIARCGDGVTRTIGDADQVEECDDGNTNEGDGCLSSCRRPHCGDGVVNREEEECDDGNSAQDDGCLNGCILARCGDGILRTVGDEAALEGCDDGNLEDGDDCLNSCEVARCGDGVIKRLGDPASLEQCDNGIYNGTSGCTEECVQVGVCSDECDGAMNGVCEDGGYLSEGSTCAYGADCTDCSPRTPDTCLEYPHEGVCFNESVIAACLTTSGTGRRELSYSVCQEYERCVEADPESDLSVEQRARCELLETFSCAPGSTECLDEQRIGYCDDEGQPQEFTCGTECVPYEAGAFCRDAPYQELTGRLQHEYFYPNSLLSEWVEEGVTVDASEVMVISYTLDGQQYRIFDISRTDRDGAFTVKVAETPGANDLIYFWLVKYHEGEPYVAVIDPGFEEQGEHFVVEIANGEAQQNARVAGASRLTTELIAAGGQATITEEEGAGQFLLFSVIGGMYDSVLALTERSSSAIDERPLLAIWLQVGVDWDCGACFVDFIHSGPVGYNDQAILFSANTDDRTYWSISVILHEFGHWVHSQFGTIPNEGGVHYLGNPTLPGQAWAEGFATLFGALVSEQSIYYSKQGGTFFWFDLAGRSYRSQGALCNEGCELSQNGLCEDGGVDSVADTCDFGSDCSDCGLRSDFLFVEPDPEGVGYPNVDDPLLQKLDENVVASSVLKAIEKAIPENGTVSPSGQRTYLLLDALQAAEVNPLNGQLIVPYTRGYVRHSWVLNELNEHDQIEAFLNEPTPSYPDFLDALRCTFQRYTQLEFFGQIQASLGLQAETLAELDAMISPALWTYPYPISEAPLCR